MKIYDFLLLLFYDDPSKPIWILFQILLKCEWNDSEQKQILPFILISSNLHSEQEYWGVPFLKELSK